MIECKINKTQFQKGVKQLFKKLSKPIVILFSVLFALYVYFLIAQFLSDRNLTKFLIILVGSCCLVVVTGLVACKNWLSRALRSFDSKQDNDEIVYFVDFPNDDEIVFSTSYGDRLIKKVNDITTIDLKGYYAVKIDGTYFIILQDESTKVIYDLLKKS